FTSPLQRAAKTCALAGFGDVAEINLDLLEWDYVIRMIAARWLGLPPSAGRCFFCGPGSVGELGFEHDSPDQPIIRLWNYVSSPRERSPPLTHRNVKRPRSVRVGTRGGLADAPCGPRFDPLHPSRVEGTINGCASRRAPRRNPHESPRCRSEWSNRPAAHRRVGPSRPHGNQDDSLRGGDADACPMRFTPDRHHQDEGTAR